jgi:anthranilate synthase component 1
MFKMLAEEEFARRAAKGGRTPVFREFLADRETPVAALSRLGADEETFLLESVAGGETRGRYSYLGIEPYAKIEGADAVERLREAFAAARFEPAPELPEFQGGAVGYVAYDAAAIFEPRLRLSREEGTPPMSFLLFDKFLVFDNVRDTVTVAVVADASAHASPREAYAAAMGKIDEIYARMLSAESIARLMERGGTADGGRPPRGTAAEFRPEMSRADFAEAVAKCKAAIRAGETIQIVPSQKFTAATDLKPLALYRALRTVNPSPYNFMMRIGAKALVGSSPEELVKLAGRTASTAPIAGTRPRGRTPARDAELERELKADEKENAEHVMLVDLGRNDLGRVCETGSVKVESFARVERYSHVMHLVSHVTGTLAKGLDAFDLLRATFPAGTLTGAPKIRAMELIEEFEKSPRGVYGGAAGYFSFTGDMDFAIVIRTMVLENGTLTMRSGAGIVADSDPDREYDETLNKAKAVFEAAKFAEEL